jgi:predicted TIM-barrel fold metal-dependent hydrolase
VLSVLVPGVRKVRTKAFGRLAPLAPLALFALAPLALLTAFAPLALHAQRAADPQLLSYIRALRAIDNHAHVVRPVPDDRDYDALPFSLLPPPPPAAKGDPFLLRPEHSMFAKAWKALYGYAYDDAAPEHVKEVVALKQKAIGEHGAGYPAWVLDKQGIDVVLANRIAMGPELQAPRFRWVPYADALIFPLDNSAAKADNADEAAFYPAEEKLLQRYMLESGVRALPATLAAYCRSVVTATLERQKAGGAVAEKFEAAYLRWLDFGPAKEADAARIYAQYVKGGPPPAAAYKTVQDYLFAYVAREAGRLGLAIHIHVSSNGGPNYDQRGGDPRLLTWVFNEPSLRNTNFVILHAGFPEFRQTASLLSKPNVYADFSGLAYYTGVDGEAEVLRSWLSQWPEKVLFGTDASPDSPAIGWEETGWIASETAREALAAALTGMIDDGEITRAQAMEFSRMVLRENAKKLYGF